MIAVVAVLLGTSCNGTAKEVVIRVENPADAVRKEVISVPYRSFLDAFGDAGPFRIMDRQSAKEVPYQLEKRGGSEVQNLLIQVEVPANGTVVLAAEKGEPAAVAAKTFARYVPERLDDFAWENDVLAFRMYGKALEGRKDDAQGTDLWVKRTDKLVIDNWYAGADYHKDHGEGMDYYSVGQTLGAGDIAPYADGKVIYPKHYRTHEILDNGPLRTTFRLGYEPWDVNGISVKVSKLISIDAGSQLNRVEVTYEADGGSALPVVIGVARRKAPGEVLREEAQGIFGYWEPEHGEDGITGVGIISEKPFSAVHEHADQYLSELAATNNEPLVYYNGGAWNKAGKITSADAWFSYLTTYKQHLGNPLKVSIQ